MARRLLSGALLGFLVALSPASSGAVLFTVDSTVDAVDANPGDGTCASASDGCTLRAAVMEANALAGAEEIQLPAGTYVFTIPPDLGDSPAAGDLDVTDSLTLSGAGAASTVVDAAALDAVFHVRRAEGGELSVALSGLTITGGWCGVFLEDASSDLLLLQVAVEGNNGCGIAQSGGGHLRVEQSLIAGNTDGGVFSTGSYDRFGGCSDAGTLALENTTVSGNAPRFPFFGAGVSVGWGGLLMRCCPNVTSIRYSTITGNAGTGLSSCAAGSIELSGSVIASQASGADCSAAPTSAGHNLDGDGSCGLSQPTDLSNTDPLLGPLQTNGGPTRTHWLLPGSPTIAAIPVAACTHDDDGDPGTPEVPLELDQRGEPRPVGTGCDIGAVEVPEPAHALMLVTGALVLAAVRRRRREMFANSPRRVAPRRQLLVLAALLVALPAGAVTIDWVPIGNPGNAPDTASNCFAANCGSVADAYKISKYEVTNAQYAEFLNAKAASDPLGLYNPFMGSDATLGGITQSGSDGSYNYAAKPGFENKPVVYVSFYDALRFANWLNNGQGNGETEAGAYSLLGGTPEPSNGTTVTRNPGAIRFLPSENEWYKAAYYSPGGTYFEYPTGTDEQTACVAPASDTGNAANCAGAVGALTDVGAYGLSDSPFRTFDQGGNVWEWNETAHDPDRGLRGGGWGPDNVAGTLAASVRSFGRGENERIGFRVAPEPARLLLVLTGALVLVASAARVAALRA